MEAVRNLDLTIEEGTVFGFIGPNGAGKSTTMQILATLLKPTSGQAWVAGFDVVKEAAEVRKRIGYMPDFFGVYDNLTALEYLEFYGACYRLSQETCTQVGLELLELVNLLDKRDEQVDLLSRGMKQRLGLARALVHDPDLLILDEPASGLDPRARIEFRAILKELGQMGKTILISSHILPELGDLCDAIGVMEQGKLIAQGSVADITAQIQPGRVVKITLLNRMEEALKWLENQEEVEQVQSDKETLTVRLGGDEIVQAQLLSKLVGAGFTISQFAEAQVNIEDVFMNVIRSHVEVSENEVDSETIS
nr:ABC transporter ATP-binding protein [Polycladospora coralii]